MVLFLNDLKAYLEDEGVSTKYIKRGILYCRADSRHASLKVFVRDPEHTDTPYEVMKEGMSGNAWGEEFETEEELAEFILEKQS